MDTFEGMDQAALIAHLTAERDKAREECGVAKSKAAFYEAEMYRYLEKLRTYENESPRDACTASGGVTD
jgi:hypothetical protein